MGIIHRSIQCVWEWLFRNVESDESPAASAATQHCDAAERTATTVTYSIRKEDEPSDWCLVGNIVEEHRFGESGEIRRGSKQFSPGTKVYCLPPQWGDGFENVVVVGICRGSRRWITVVMPRRLITNWRPKVVYSPVVLRRLRNGFEGHNNQWTSREQVEAWARAYGWRGEPGP